MLAAGYHALVERLHGRDCILLLLKEDVGILIVFQVAIFFEDHFGTLRNLRVRFGRHRPEPDGLNFPALRKDALELPIAQIQRHVADEACACSPLLYLESRERNDRLVFLLFIFLAHFQTKY